jgi:signal peptidase I
MPVEKSKPRRRIAPVASLIEPGAGQVAVGNYRRGLLWFVLHCAAVLAVTLGLLASAIAFWLLFAVAQLIRLASALDVIRLPAADPARLPSWRKTALLWIALMATGQLEVAAIRANLVESFKIPAGSMIPTLLVGDHLFVDKRAREPGRGDVIVFKPPGRKERFIKRVVAIAGDTIELRDGVIWLNGRAVERRHVDAPCAYWDRLDRGGWLQRSCDRWQESIDGASYPVIFDPGPGPARSFAALTVAPGSVYVLGDNRDNSHDSRFFGSIPQRDIQGRALSLWWSSDGAGIHWSRIGQAVR